MKMYGIVRDANGKPRFDDPASAPPEMLAMLTDADILKLSDEEISAMGLVARKAAITKGA